MAWLFRAQDLRYGYKRLALEKIGVKRFINSTQLRRREMKQLFP